MPSSTVEAKRATAVAYFEAISRGDKDGAADFFAEDAVILSMSRTLIPPVIRGRDTIRFMIAQITDTFPKGLRLEVIATTVENDRVAVEVESSGEHVSKKQYNNRYHFLMKFEGEKIREMREYLDSEMVTDVLFDGARPQPGDVPA